MKIFLKAVLSRLGYCLARNERGQSLNKADTYEAAVFALKAASEDLNILVVGANDGKTSDPIFPALVDLNDCVNVLFVEPNSDVIPYLLSNAKIIKNASVFQGAVSFNGEEEVTIYRVKKKYWAKLQPGYAKKRDWDTYRAPSGITSTVRSEVEKWVGRFSELKKAGGDSFIESVLVKAKSLEQLISDYFGGCNIDVLQVDVEGVDDYVVQSALNRSIFPHIIHFEAKHVPKERLDRVEKRLETNAYKVYQIAGDILAIRCLLGSTRDSRESR